MAFKGNESYIPVKKNSSGPGYYFDPASLRLKIQQARLGFSFIKKFANNWLKIKIAKSSILDPLFGYYLVTKRCNFRCRYCYAESNERIASTCPEDLNEQDTLKILKIMRKDVDNIYFSGGEPLLRKDIVDIVKACRTLNYHIVGLTTNGILLPRKHEIAEYLDYLTISLDTLDEKKNDMMCGVKDGTSKKIIEIIKEFAAMQKEKKFSLLINAVITEHNIPDIYDLMDFCFRYNIGLSVIGQMENLRPIAFLRNNKEYFQLVETILDLNAKGYPIIGMPDFNRTMLTFQDHTCYPTLIPTVYPNGDLLYPCEVLNSRRYNLLETGSISRALKLGQKEFGKKINCPGECYLPAFITASCFMEQPMSAIKQAVKLRMGNCYNTEIVENKAWKTKTGG
ncbi:MAG: radical SAM protein [Spirochaetales bacterium]|nr:radical SAM protein [Spirochaetales bacterium]